MRNNTNGIKRGPVGLSLAIQQARKSPCGYKHGAVLIQNGRVLGAGYNVHGRPPCKGEIAERPRGWIHAEASALVHVKRSQMHGATMLVVRVNPKGLLRDSKPCTKCLRLLRRRGIRKVVYSTSAGNFLNCYL